MSASRRHLSDAALPRVGWREWVALPDLGVTATKAKIDTGARSSALHAFNLESFDSDGFPWVRFVVHPHQRSMKEPVTVEAPVVDVRSVRSSSGKAQHRPVIRTRLGLGEYTFTIDLTLTRRDEMGFRMLIGREALRRRFVVDAGASYVASTPPPRT